jgi:hypothetical protein
MMQVNFVSYNNKTIITWISLILLLLISISLNSENTTNLEINYKFLDDFKHSEDKFYVFDPMHVLEMKITYRKVKLIGSFGKSHWENQVNSSSHYAPCDVWAIGCGVSYELKKGMFYLEPQINLRDYMISYDAATAGKDFSESEFSAGYELELGAKYKMLKLGLLYSHDKIFSSKPIKINYYGVKFGIDLHTPFFKGVVL